MLPLITVTGAGITIMANILLIPALGMVGAAIATLMCYSATSLMILYYSRKYMPVPYKLGKALLMMAIAVTALWISTQNMLPFSGDFTGRLVIFIGSLFILIAIGLSNTKFAFINKV